MAFYVYVLQSRADGTLYLGSTQDVKARLERHNRGRVRYTSRKRPWDLLGTIPCLTRSEAVKLERQLKRWKNPERVRQFLAKDRHN